MAKLFFIHDYSPSRIWLHTALIAQKDALFANNIAIAPFSEWSCEPVKSHNTLWHDFYTPALPPWYIMKQLAGVKASIEEGKDILVWGEPMRPLQLEFFWRILADYLEINQHEYRSLFILCNPAMMLECQCREFGNVVGFSQQLAAFPEFLKRYCEITGRYNCFFINNSTGKPYETPHKEIFNRISEFLITEIPVPSASPAHPLIYRSNLARRLDKALEPRENSWPSVDLRECILKLDADLDEDFMSPLTLRTSFADGILQAELEETCGFEAGALHASAPYFEKPETAPDTPLTILDWTRNLPPLEAARLSSRLGADECVLNSDQRSLLEALKSAGHCISLEVMPAEPLVTVLTMTYNQELFIKNCMDSVQMQQTTFPIQHIVLDHHSGDSTPAIIADYATRYPSIRPVLLSQRREYENVRGLYLRCKSKYAIFCDGDDYFTDPLKLQTQVDYLERHPELSFCFHPVAAVYDDGSENRIFPALSLLPDRPGDVFDLGDLASGNFIQTNSVLYRWRFGAGLPTWFRADICLTDWYCHMLHAETGNFGFIPSIMAAYRRHSGAMFAARSVSALELRRKMGIPELVAIEACVSHFDRKYHPAFIGLACQVLKDFTTIADQEGYKALIEFARKRFPLFAAEFDKSAGEPVA